MVQTPPCLPAELPLTVQLVSVACRQLQAAASRPMLPLMVQLVSVAVPIVEQARRRSWRSCR